jgi:energy-coupling factor transporter ATP-binding protein EcfA2
MTKIYVSSTYQDMRECRERTRHALHKLGYEVVAMEYYDAENRRPVEKCLEDVSACDLYLGIFAWRYGFIPRANNPDLISITEMEYRHAIEEGKECLIFLLDEKAKWLPEHIDNDRAPIKKLRTILQDRHLTSFFKSPEDIGEVVKDAIHKWKEKKETSERQFSSAPVLKQEASMLQQRDYDYKGNSFDDQPCTADLIDINEEALRFHVQNAGERLRNVPAETLPVPFILQALGLYHGGALKRAAVLVFGKNPQQFFPQAKVKCARLKGLEFGEVIDEDTIDGTLIDQVSKCEKFILRNIRKGWIIEGFERKEKWEYPLEALREAVVNSIVHRDYHSNGEVQIRIFDDRIEIRNPGRLPDSISMSDIFVDHSSFPRNKLVAECFYRIKLNEQWGSGIQRIIKRCRDYKLPDPEFSELTGSFLVVLRGLGEKFREILNFDLSSYYAALKKRYQRLDLEVLTPPQREEYLQLQLGSVFVEQMVRENPPPIELPKDVWEKLQGEREINPEDLPANVHLDDVVRARETYYEYPVQPVLDALTNPSHQHMVILGDPGSGKSTLARYVLLSMIGDQGNEKLRETFDGFMPLLIELRSYAGLLAEGKCDTFLEFLDYMGETEGWHLNKDALHQYLKTDGRAVVIFDGLDEIFEPAARERVARRIAGFASDYPKARVIVTSRVIGYRRKVLENAGFAHFTLQDLDEQQVATFVDRWYSLASHDRPDEARDRAERIMRSFKESVSIRQLAGNPMLLTIMAIIGKHQELPRERWKLYDHAASVLIQHWDVNKHLQDQSVNVDLIEEEDKKELLRRLAYKMQGGAGGLAGNYIYREQLQKEFEVYLRERYELTTARSASTARAMIDQFRERSFILSLYGANVYGFVHRAFLEFFCATAFVYKFEKTQEITLEQLKQEVYGAHWREQSWHEVLRLICGMIDENFAIEIIDYLAGETDDIEVLSTLKTEIRMPRRNF